MSWEKINKLFKIHTNLKTGCFSDEKLVENNEVMHYCRLNPTIYKIGKMNSYLNIYSWKMQHANTMSNIIVKHWQGTFYFYFYLWYFIWVLLMILTYFYLSNFFNAVNFSKGSEILLPPLPINNFHPKILSLATSSSNAYQSNPDLYSSHIQSVCLFSSVPDPTDQVSTVTPRTSIMSHIILWFSNK